MAHEWSIWKDFGYPGRVVVPGAKGQALAYTFTADDFAQMVRTGNAKLADNWNVPSCWEHQDVEPVKRARLSRGQRDIQFAKGVFASIAEFATTPRGGGKVRITGTDPKDYDQLLKVKFVSPEIVWDWRDSDGKVWHGPSVTHMAATARPVQRHQHAFGTDPDAPYPSRPAPASVSGLSDVIRMSFAAQKTAPGVSPRLLPFARLRLALDHYAEPPMPEDTDTGSTDFGGGGPGGKKKLTPWERIAAALADHCGIDLGDVSEIKDPDEFARLVDVAAANYKAGSEPEGDEFDQPPDEDNQADQDAPPEGDMDQPPPGATAPPPPVQMSLQKAQERAAAIERKNLAAEINDLERTRRIGPHTANKLRQGLARVRLSFGSDGELESNSVTVQIEALKELPANAAWSQKGKKKPAANGGKGGKKPVVRLSVVGNDGGVREVGPSQYEDNTDGASDDEVVAAFENNVGRGKAE